MSLLQNSLHNIDVSFYLIYSHMILKAKYVHAFFKGIYSLILCVYV